LAYEADPDEEAAGIEVFSKYGDLNILETLSGRDVTRWNDVKALKYSEFLTKMLMNKDARAFEKKLAEIKRANKE
jgi:hypothetical protein